MVFTCVKLYPILDINKNRIAEIKRKHKLSTIGLSNILGVSILTVRRWEIGMCKPRGCAKSFLSALYAMSDISELYCVSEEEQ